MTVNRAIGRLAALFVVLFAILAARQIWVQVIAGPSIAAKPYNPRVALLQRYRGTIVARDGTVLAASTAHGRVYPLGAALAQTVGYDSARYGTTGLEAAFDAELSPRAASNDPLTQLGRLLGLHGGPERGATVVTTIDPAVQRTLYAALSAYPRAAGVALDPRTGEVLALASVPSFDPQTIERTFGEISTDTASPLLNRALDGLYPPGSTFKIVIAADALDAGVVTLDSTFDDPGSYKVGDFVMHDDEGEATGRRSLTGAFALSSNVDFAQIALELGKERFFDYAARWRLGESLEFTLPASRDHLPSPESVSPSILAQLGFGQADLTVTPLRMALVGATIASGGSEPRPTLLRGNAPGPRDADRSRRGRAGPRHDGRHGRERHGHRGGLAGRPGCGQNGDRDQPGGKIGFMVRCVRAGRGAARGGRNRRRERGLRRGFRGADRAARSGERARVVTELSRGRA